MANLNNTRNLVKFGVTFNRTSLRNARLFSSSSHRYEEVTHTGQVSMSL